MVSLMARKYKKMSFKGDVVITRMNRHDRDEIEIRFTDGGSRVTFAEVHLTLEQFALAVTGMHVPDVEMETTDLAYVGRKRLHRTELVEASDSSRLSDEDRMELCRPVMKRLKKETGLNWDPHLRDVGNMHKSNKERTGYHVVFTAYEKRRVEE